MSAAGSIEAFWEVASVPTRDALITISGAVVLTDALACSVLKEVGTEIPCPDRFVQLIHHCDFVVERNSEWHLKRDIRAFLLHQLLERGELAKRVHKAIGDFASSTDTSRLGDLLPYYLATTIGKAYHTAIFDPDMAINLYREAYRPDLSGIQWLLGILAEEQLQTGILPASALEPLFYRGMTCYKEGAWRDAQQYLARVAGSDQVCNEVAVALHILGLLTWRLDHRLTPALDLLKRSISIGEQIHDHVHEAQAWHSYGNLLAIKRRDHETEDAYKARCEDAKDAYDTSLGLWAAPFHQGKVWHSYGKLFAQEERYTDAADAYQTSLDLLSAPADQAKVHVSWADMLRTSPDPADLKDAIDHARLAADLRDWDKKTQGHTYRILADAFEKLRQPAEAISALTNLRKTNAALGITWHDDQIAETLARLRLQLKEDAD